MLHENNAAKRLTPEAKAKIALLGSQVAVVHFEATQVVALEGKAPVERMARRIAEEAEMRREAEEKAQDAAQRLRQE